MRRHVDACVALGVYSGRTHRPLYCIYVATLLGVQNKLIADNAIFISTSVRAVLEKNSFRRRNMCLCESESGCGGKSRTHYYYVTINSHWDALIRATNRAIVYHLTVLIHIST